MPSHIKMLLKVIIFFGLVFTTALTVPAQRSIEELQKILREQANFSDDDFSDLTKGKTIVKLLPVEDEREVAVCGIVRLPNASDTSLTAFQNSLTQRNNKSVMDYVMLSKPLNPEELQSLMPEKADIEAMKKCAVGNCNLKMSAAMIQRLQTEIDWNAPDYDLRATQVFRQMLFEYIQDYSARGNKALLKLDNRKKAVSLEEEHRALLGNLRFINNFAPEFTKYLQNFPDFELAGVENELYWSKIKFGLKPTITVTHTAGYSSRINNVPQFLVAAQQIYASRYIESSLALTILINIPVNDSAVDSYILFTNHSRSDSLDGMFSDFKRSIVEQEATERVKELLQQTKTRLRNNANNQPDAASETDETGITARLWTAVQKPLVQFFLVLFLVAFLGFLYWRGKLSASRR